MKKNNVVKKAMGLMVIMTSVLMLPLDVYAATSETKDYFEFSSDDDYMEGSNGPTSTASLGVKTTVVQSY